MRATIPYIQQRFDEFNRQMFDGKLPPLPIQLSNAKTFLGMCVYKRHRRWYGKVEKYDFRLRINTRIDLPEQEIEDTIIHEMIHYYIGINQFRDTSAHGQLFRQMMNDINHRFHRNIRVSHHITDEQREQAIDKRCRWHVIAVVKFSDGRYGIKVLPRVRQSIDRYYHLVSQAPGVESIQLYKSNNPFFNRYPSSSSLKVHFLSEEDIHSNLSESEAFFPF